MCLTFKWLVALAVSVVWVCGEGGLLVADLPVPVLRQQASRTRKYLSEEKGKKRVST